MPSKQIPLPKNKIFSYNKDNFLKYKPSLNHRKLYDEQCRNKAAFF